MTKYPAIFSPLKVGAHTLKNRFIFNGVTTGLETLSEFENEWVNFYQSRCSDHGPGLFNVPHGAICFSGKLHLDSPSLDTSFYHKSFRLTSFLRSRGSEVIVQLMHHGLGAEHFAAVASSRLFHTETRYRTHKIENIFIEKYIKLYAQQAYRAVNKGGFTGVEICGARLSLPNTFSCPVLNKRTDQWGGENRFKFSTSIVRRVRDYIGPTPLLSYRLSLMDLVPTGNSWEDVIDFAKKLEFEGVDLLSFDIGLLNDTLPMDTDLTPPGVWYPFIEAFSKEISLPVTLLPPEGSVSQMEEYLERDQKSLLELKHSLISDPEWGEKLFYKTEKDIIPSVSGSGNCITSTPAHEKIPLCCISSPYVTIPFERKTLKSVKNKLLIIGGGPAGIGAAEHAARSGIETTLVEERPVLGGMLRLASMIPGKEKLKELLEKKEEQLLQLGVEIVKGVRASASWIQANYPKHTIFLATGCQPMIPDIPGVDSLNVMTFEDLLLRQTPIGHRVAIIGESRIALDTARYLVMDKTLNSEEWLQAWGIGNPQEHRSGCLGVIPYIDTLPRSTYLILEKKLYQYKETLHSIELLPELQWIRMNGVQIVTESSIEMIDPASVRIRNLEDDTTTHYRIDHIVIADELEPRDELFRALEELGVNFEAIGSLKDSQKLFGGAINVQNGRSAVDSTFF